MIKYYASENVLEEFYKNLLEENPKKRVHLPHSSVFYVREAIFGRTGEWYTLDQVERAMYLEGHLSKEDVLDPDRDEDNPRVVG
jgi:hypothetical protein